MSVSIHEHEFVVAERDALRQQLDELAAIANKWASAYAEKDAEIEEIKGGMAYRNSLLCRIETERDELRQQLAASQAREQQLRNHIALALEFCDMPAFSVAENLANALAMPQDTSALEAMIAKTDEVVRDRCCDDLRQRLGSGYSKANCEAIRALPGVTLEDLKQ